MTVRVLDEAFLERLTAPNDPSDRFQMWTLDSALGGTGADADALRDKVLMRSARLLEAYGPYDDTKPTFKGVMQELIFQVAELSYHYSSQVRTIVSSVKSERIGSYSYDRGQINTSFNPTQSVIDNNAIVMGMITHLKDNSTVPVFSTYVFPRGPIDTETGDSTYVDDFGARVAWAIRRGLVGSETEYLLAVYGRDTF